MIEADFAYAFTVGMVAAVNPCGFALLPAYLSYFLGLEGAPTDSRASMVRALGVALAVTTGFVAVFGIIGLAITQLSLSINRQLPWVTMAIGVAIVVLGIAMLRGFQLSLRLPRLSVGGSSRELPSMFLFGVSYAVASLSCTLPIFLPIMTRTFGSNSLTSGVAVFLTYAAGMGLLLGAITMALAGARGALVTRLRRAQPHINRVSGGLLVLAGVYLAYYGYWEHRVYTDPRNLPPSGPVDVVTSASASVTNWVSSIGATRIGVVLAAAVVIVLILVFTSRDSSETPTETPSEPAPTRPVR
ncbi:MAG: cytochrome c biogenesis CcdA family protein [Acidimicrobiales bacterium]|nr:cytochrome c biogenesis CcdA family protein [Acidimicrobiales bacterium]